MKQKWQKLETVVLNIITVKVSNSHLWRIGDLCKYSSSLTSDVFDCMCMCNCLAGFRW